MSLKDKIISYSYVKEPFAGGTKDFAKQIKASLPFLQLIFLPKAKVLVVGCGEGYEVKWLQDHGFKAVGVTNNVKEEEIWGLYKSC